MGEVIELCEQIAEKSVFAAFISEETHCSFFAWDDGYYEMHGTIEDFINSDNLILKAFGRCLKDLREKTNAVNQEGQEG